MLDKRVYAQLPDFSGARELPAREPCCHSCGSNITAWLISAYPNRLIF